MTYKHITQTQRYQISALKATGACNSSIAKAIGVHKTTIGRELKLNGGRRSYNPDIAETKAFARKSNANCANASKNFDEVWIYVCRLICLDYSPEQASARIKAELGLSISHETIYQRIYNDKANGGNLHTHLRCQKLKRKRYGSGQERRGVIKNQVNISQRPEVVEKRQRIGDFEGDTVIGKNHQGGFVTLVDRYSRYLLAAHISCKRADVVTSSIIKLLKPHKDRCHTITFDNGKEFAYHEKIAKKLLSDVFFANPYHSWERGTNENTNGLLRQYFPKGMNLLEVPADDVQNMLDRINHRPRKILGYKSAYEVFFDVSMCYATKDNSVALRS